MGARKKIKLCERNCETVRELSLRLNQGNLENLPDQITLNLKSASEEDYQAFLELVRYQSFGHKILATAGNKSDLQNVRALINTGKFSTAIDKARVFAGDPEFIIEQARGYVFTQQFERTLDILQDLVNDESLPAHNRGVAWQMRGHAYLEIGNIAEAQKSFENALFFDHRAGNTLGKISAQLFIAKRMSFDGEFLLAREQFALALENLLHLGGFRWLLGFYRHLSFMNHFAGSPRCISEAYAGLRIAKQLGDSLFEAKGWAELIVMESRFGKSCSQSDPDVLKFVESQCESTKSDLPSWRLAAFQKASLKEIETLSRPSETLRRFLTLQKTESLGGPFPSFNISDQPTWIYDRTWNLLIDLAANKFFRLSAESPSAKILLQLAAIGKNDYVPLSELFEKNWNLKWDYDRHRSLMSVTLQRLRHLSPSLKVERKDGGVKLLCPGIVI